MADANRERERERDGTSVLLVLARMNGDEIQLPAAWLAHRGAFFFDETKGLDEMNDSWPEIIRDAKPEWRNRAR